MPQFHNFAEDTIYNFFSQFNVEVPKNCLCKYFGQMCKPVSENKRIVSENNIILYWSLQMSYF